MRWRLDKTIMLASIICFSGFFILQKRVQTGGSNLLNSE